MHQAKVNTISVELPSTGKNIAAPGAGPADITGQQVCDDAVKDAPKNAHKPFSWLHDSLRHDREAEFAATTFDICRGIDLCIELVHSSDLERSHNTDANPGEECLPVLGPVDTETLLQFVMASAKLLAGNADRRIEWLNDAALRKLADASKGGEA